MVRSRNKHVCNPGARRSNGAPWKRKSKPKTRIIAVERMPADYLPEVKGSKIDPLIKNLAGRSNVPGITITSRIETKNRVRDGAPIRARTLDRSMHEGYKGYKFQKFQPK